MDKKGEGLITKPREAVAQKSLESIRGLLKERKLTAYIIPTDDAHQSEYIAQCDERRAFITGFTGSAGTALITQNSALLWTDGRYFLQAAKELYSGWVLMKTGEDVTLETWLQINLPLSSTIGIDFTLFSVQAWMELNSSVQPKNIQVLNVPISQVVDCFWTDRPALPSRPAFLLDESKYAGRTTQLKLTGIRETMASKSVGLLISSGLDEVAWVYNIRGDDVPYNPVVMSYSIITLNEARIYIRPNQVTEEVKKHLTSYNVTIHPYDSFFDDLPKIIALAQGKIWIDTETTSMAIFLPIVQAVGLESRVHEGASPVVHAKAIKNQTELAGMRNCHIRDAAALISWIAWLEEVLPSEGTPSTFTEWTVAEELEKKRSQQADYVSLSFESILGSGSNGAIIHYTPEAATAAIVERSKLLLVDSGGQYKDGTTDVTRTFWLGSSTHPPSEFEVRAYTRVLQGHIGLARSVFVEGTDGKSLDVFARTPLWTDGLDYRHGTGHGVGSFLNVHEGPQGIGTRKGVGVPLLPGMTVTNEPGYYEDGKFGVRIENVMIVKLMDTPYRFKNKNYIGFEQATLVPYQRRLMNLDLMNNKEIEWVNEYHKECLDKVGKLLEEMKDERGLRYLQRECAPIKN